MGRTALRLAREELAALKNLKAGIVIEVLTPILVRV
jgi:hypothetical protein